MNKKNTNIPLDPHLLIAAVFARPPLWDRNNLLHKNIDFTESLWNEVSSELDLPKDILKTRWKGLKDTFRKECKKRGARKPKWVHFKKLSFLKESINASSKESATKGSSDDDTSNDLKDDIKETSVEGCEMDTNEEKKEEDETVKEESENKMKKDNKLLNKGELLTEVTAVETQTSFVPSEGTDSAEVEAPQVTVNESAGNEVRRPWENGEHFQRIDDDYHFFMSLVPHFKSLPPDQKLILRMKMQDIVYKELFGLPK